MNPTYLANEYHGVHVVYDHDELRKCQEIGWVMIDQERYLKEGKIVPLGEAVEGEAPARRGRPPKQ